ncbi:MAG TPA: SRPBCC domain-containing protein [Chloroflexota bacterium]|nr:SRPBCC domain-containing protein [Chloroflexota bacterium]
MTEDGTTLRMSRVVNAAPQDVWTAWTEPTSLSRWWWPERFRTDYAIDLRPGGRYHYRTDEIPGMGVLSLRGTYQEVASPERITYSWDWENGEPVTAVTVEFVGRDSGTEICLAHGSFATSEERDNHIVGWNDCLDRLAAMFPAGV